MSSAPPAAALAVRGVISWAPGRRCTPPPPGVVPGRGWPPENQGIRRAHRPARSTATLLTTLQALEKELDKVRRCHGVAYDLDEVENGVRCIAAGIRDDSGELVAGFVPVHLRALPTPTAHPLIRQTADEIQRRWAIIPPPAR